jgi:hypothetical protein
MIPSKRRLADGAPAATIAQVLHPFARRDILDCPGKIDKRQSGEQSRASAGDGETLPVASTTATIDGACFGGLIGREAETDADRFAEGIESRRTARPWAIIAFSSRSPSAA